MEGKQRTIKRNFTSRFATYGEKPVYVKSIPEDLTSTRM
jgi:hypothetical protein